MASIVQMGPSLHNLKNIARVERGLFAFKPSNGFLILLNNPMSRAWHPGLWWRFGRRIGIGGVTPQAEGKVHGRTHSHDAAEPDLSAKQHFLVQCLGNRRFQDSKSSAPRRGSHGFARPNTASRCRGLRQNTPRPSTKPRDLHRGLLDITKHNPCIPIHGTTRWKGRSLAAETGSSSPPAQAERQDEPAWRTPCSWHPHTIGTIRVVSVNEI